MSDLGTHLTKEFDYFLKRLPEVVALNPEFVSRMLEDRSMSDLPSRFAEEIPFYSKAEIWAALAVLISLVVRLDQGKVTPGEARVI